MEPYVLCPNCARWSPVDDYTSNCRYCGATYHNFRVRIPHLCYLNRQAHSDLMTLYAKCAAALVGIGLVGWPLGSTVSLWPVWALVFGAAAAVPVWGWRKRRDEVVPRFPDVFANPAFRKGIPGNAKYNVAGRG